MTSMKVVITDPIGLHARPASVLTKVASKFISNITIIAGEKTGNLKSIMNIMALAIKTNTEITIQADGEDEEIALESIKTAMIENSLIS